MNALNIQHLSIVLRQHFWSRSKTLLSDLCLNVEQGEIFGFLGPNGAGKTTTIKSLIGLMTATQGTVEIFGVDYRCPESRKRVGFMPERAYFPPYLNAREFVMQHALLADVPLRNVSKRVDQVIERVGLHHVTKEKLTTYSKGMLQRVGLAQALVGDPDLLILDEPMSGLDPIGRKDIREIMLDLRKHGKTIFFSTHIIPDVELVCDRVGILVGGKLTRSGTLHDMVGEHLGTLEDVFVKEAQKNTEGRR